MTAREKQAGIREVSASGSHREIGLSIGKQCRDQARRMEARHRKALASIPGMTLEKAIAGAKKSLPLTREYYPEFLEEMEGYAEGTGIDFDTLYAGLCDYPLGGRGCTDIAVNAEWTKDDCVYAAHNEDVEPYNQADVAIARIRPKDEPGFVGVCYGGLFPTVAMNAEGIALTGNALVPNDTRLGIPKMVPVRKVLKAKGLYDALKFSMPEGRGHSFNNIVSDSNGEIYSMEGSATAFDALYAEGGYLIHTNHYLSPRMWRYEENLHTRMSSIIRYNRARKLFKVHLGQVEVSTFKNIFSDHVGYPESICRHPDPSLPDFEQVKTIFSTVFDLTRKVMWLCPGNPCEGEFKEHPL